MQYVHSVCGVRCRGHMHKSECTHVCAYVCNICSKSEKNVNKKE